MDKKNLIPEQAQPIERITTGQLGSELAELSEEMLTGIMPLGGYGCATIACACGCGPDTNGCYCSYEGDDAE